MKTTHDKLFVEEIVEEREKRSYFTKPALERNLRKNDFRRRRKRFE